MHHSTHSGAHRHRVRTAVLATAGVGVLALSACSGASSPTSGDATQSGASPGPRGYRRHGWGRPLLLHL
jgi:hypothetical protein